MSTELPGFVELTTSSQRKVRKYTSAERKTHCEEWRQSGLSMNEYCRRSGLLVSTFSLWVKKLNTLPGMDSQRLELTSKSVNQPSLEIILVSGIVLRFTDVANIAEILRLIKALECS
jgi:hypothetical protein